MTHLNQVLQGHLNSTQWRPNAATGKGGGKGTFAKTNQANVHIQQSGADFAAAVKKAVSAELSKTAAKDDQAKKREEAEAKNAEKKRLKALEQEERKVAGAVARPTRLCYRPSCLFAGTYSTSAKCFSCKICFEAPAVPTPTPVATALPPTNSPLRRQEASERQPQRPLGALAASTFPL